MVNERVTRSVSAPRPSTASAAGARVDRFCRFAVRLVGLALTGLVSSCALLFMSSWRGQPDELKGKIALRLVNDSSGALCRFHVATPDDVPDDEWAAADNPQDLGGKQRDWLNGEIPSGKDIVFGVKPGKYQITAVQCPGPSPGAGEKLTWMTSVKVRANTEIRIREFRGGLLADAVPPGTKLPPPGAGAKPAGQCMQLGQPCEYSTDCCEPWSCTHRADEDATQATCRHPD
jgi:hypothetical protein